MKLVTIDDGHQSRAALVADDGYLELDAEDVGEVLRRGVGPLELATGKAHDIGDVRILAPVLQPGKILGVGTNYIDVAVSPHTRGWTAQPVTHS